MRFLWPEVRLAIKSLGLGAVLERPVLAGEKADPGLVFPAGDLSLAQYLILCTELSKLLQKA